MTSRDLLPDEGPELLPPAELLRLRAELARPPGDDVRSQHVAATAMAARQRGHSHVGRFASRGARAAVAIVASLAITSGLAGAQLLPDQAQRLLSNVSERFAPTDGDPPADPATPGDATTVRPTRDDGAPDGEGQDPISTTATVATAAVEDTPTTTTAPRVSVSTTIPGPSGPGSPDDPTDPGSTTTVPPTTTTTQPPTTTTTVPPTTTTTTTVVAPPPTGGDRR